MNSIINLWVFYWIEVGDMMHRLMWVGVTIGVFLLVMSFCCTDEGNSIWGEYEHKVRKVSMLLASFCLICVVFIPSEETCYKMLAANMFTQDNINSATEYVTDVIDYAVDKVKELQPNTEE